MGGKPYDEIEIEDMTYNEETQIYYFPCPCGDKFSISLAELHEFKNVATCPSCSLFIEVVFDYTDLPDLKTDKAETSQLTPVTPLVAQAA